MHTRYARAAVAGHMDDARPAQHPSSSIGRPNPPGRSAAQVLWATRPLKLKHCTLVAVMLCNSQLFIRAVALETQVGRWVPADELLTAAQADSWAQKSRFYR